MPVESIDTPALVVDLDAMERNLATMAAFARGARRAPPAARQDAQERDDRASADRRRRGRRLRPEDERGRGARRRRHRRHLHLERGDRPAPSWRASRRSRGAHPPGDRGRLGRRRRAARRGGRGGGQHDRGLRRGRRRSGPLRRAPAAAGSSRSASSRTRRPKAASSSPALQAYHGAAQHLRGAAEREAAAHTPPRWRARRRPASAPPASPARWSRARGTGTFAFDAASGLWGELQAGSYLFMDRDYADNAPTPGAPRFEHALFVKSRVISRGAAHAVVDAGHKSHAIDSGLPRVWQRELDYVNGGDEHGILRPPLGAGAASCRRSAPRSGWCRAIATRPSTCTTATSPCAAAWSPASSRRSGRSRRAAASADARRGHAGRAGLRLAVGAASPPFHLVRPRRRTSPRTSRRSLAQNAAQTRPAATSSHEVMSARLSAMCVEDGVHGSLLGVAAERPFRPA